MTIPDTTHTPRPVEAQPGVFVHTRAERNLAVGQWLLLSAPDKERAQTEWSTMGVALLRCGALFTAVRLSATLVQAASGTDDVQKIDGFLAEALYGGPVFVDTHIQRYYILVPRSTADRQEWHDQPRQVHAECLEPGCFLGVPDVITTNPSLGRSCWCVPMDGPGNLCSPEAVSQLVAYGRHRLAEATAGE